MTIQQLMQLEEALLRFMMELAPNAEVIANARRAVTRERKRLEREEARLDQLAS